MLADNRETSAEAYEDRGPGEGKERFMEIAGIECHLDNGKSSQSSWLQARLWDVSPREAIVKVIESWQG